MSPDTAGGTQGVGNHCNIPRSHVSMENLYSKPAHIAGLEFSHAPDRHQPETSHLTLPLGNSSAVSLYPQLDPLLPLLGVDPRP